MELLQSLLSNFGSLFLVVFFFGSSIFVHELGHFLAARRRGLKVERFSIGFGPTLFGWRGKDGVEYCLAWFPLGGYVRLPQLADLRELEGDSNTNVSDLPAPSYLTKLIVFLAGAVFNVIFAFLLACVLWVIGFPTAEDDSTTRIGYVVRSLTLPDNSTQPSPASKADIRPGDVVLAIDGNEVKDWSGIQQALFLGSGRTADGSDRLVHLRIKRGDQILEKDLNPVLAGDEKFRKIGISPAQKVIVGQVTSGTSADQAGLKPGDYITKVGTDEVLHLAQLMEYLESHAASPAIPLELTRGGTTATVSIQPQKSAQETLAGVVFTRNIQLVRENPVDQFRAILSTTFRSLAGLINPRSDIGLSKMSGPIGIFTQFWQAATSDYPVRVAMWLTILINISLAVFNLLPIPVLDGGHILFATIAKLRGRALPADFIQGATSVFIVLLFSMILYVSYNDVRRIMRDRGESAAPPPASTPVPVAPPAPAPAPSTP